MTTELVVMERALTVVAVCLAIQTLMMVGGLVAAFVAFRKVQVAVDEKAVELEAHIVDVKASLDRVLVTVDGAASAVKRGTVAVGEVVDDARQMLGNVRDGVASVASVATAPKTAVAIGVVRGVQWWRRRRAAERLATGSEL